MLYIVYASSSPVPRLSFNASVALALPPDVICIRHVGHPLKRPRAVGARRISRHDCVSLADLVVDGLREGMMFDGENSAWTVGKKSVP